MKQCHQEQRYTQPPSSGKAFADAAVLTRALRCVRYASAAYHNTQEDTLTTIHGEEEDAGGNIEILHMFKSEKGAKVSCPNFFVAKDKGTHELVLSIRGMATMS